MTNIQQFNWPEKDSKFLDNFTTILTLTTIKTVVKKVQKTLMYEKYEKSWELSVFKLSWTIKSVLWKPPTEHIMSVNLAKNRESLLAAYKNVLENKNDTDWWAQLITNDHTPSLACPIST